MAGFSLANYNPFILLSSLFAIILLIQYLIINQPRFQSNKTSLLQSNSLRFLCLRLGKSFHHFLIVSLCVNLCLVPFYHAYYVVYECSVSRRYHDETINQSMNVMNIMKSANMDYWLDFATLLASIRQQSINQWDHDSDFSTVHPDYPALPIIYPSFIQSKLSSVNQSNNQSVAVNDQYLAPLARAQTGFIASDEQPSQSLKQYLAIFESRGLFVDWKPKRHLLQIWQDQSKTGPHIDLWLWVPARHPDGTIWLYTADHTIHYNPRPLIEVLPLVDTEWLDTKTKRPQKQHQISSKEYSSYGGSYMLVSVFPRDCFHNFFNMRWFY